MTPLQISAQLACDAIYDPGQFKDFDKVFLIGETVCGIKKIDDILYIVNQGTNSLEGWQADVEIETFDHPVLGSLHSGFYKNLPEVMRQLFPLVGLDEKVICCGHSKGAGEVVILSALLKLAGINVIKNYLFACPNAGFGELTAWLKINIPGVSYRNMGPLTILSDAVPLVPIYPYTPPYPHTIITQCPHSFNLFLPSSWHAANLYLRNFT